MNPAVVVDVGNSRIKWGRCAENRVAEMASLPHDEESAWQRQLDAWQIAPGSTWAVSGVQPQVRTKLVEWLERLGAKVIVLESFHQLLIPVIAVEHPEQVGLDRLLNAVAVNSVRAPDNAAIIIDAGTAVTVDYVDAAGVFWGGAILPGLRLMAKALHDYTALLPFVEVADWVEPPGRNTEKALQSGIFRAVLGGIDRLVLELMAYAGGPCEVYMAGGDASLLAPYLTCPTVTPHLQLRESVWPEMTLEGIRLSVISHE